MRIKTSILIINIAYLMFGCDNPEDIERPLPDYIIDYYGECSTCPDENFIDMKVNDSSIYFQMGILNLSLDSIRDPAEFGKSGLVLQRPPTVDDTGFGANYYRNRDSARANKLNNLSILFDFYNDQRICSPYLFFECGSYLFDETLTPEGDLNGTNASYGLRIRLVPRIFVNEEIGYERSTFISIPENAFFEIEGKEKDDNTGILRVCGSFSSELVGANDSLVHVSGTYSMEYSDFYFRYCDINR